MDVAICEAFDADSDGALDAGELTTFLQKPVPHLVIDAQLPQAKRGKPKMMIVGLWYVDTFVRTPNGWRFKERVEELLYNTTVEKVRT